MLPAVEDVERLFGPAAWPLFAGLLGLVVGSFANVCIHRIPRGASIVRPRSRCPSCAHELAAWENVPVLSFVLLRGRCRRCAAPISWRYPAVELANGALWLGVALSLPPSPRALALQLFVTALLILSFIDREHYLLPDVITLPGIAAGLLCSLLPDWPVKPLEALAAALGGYLGMLLVGKGYERLRGIEGLGQGDWKMAAMLGAFLGWQALLLTVLLASLAGTLVGLGALLRGTPEGLRTKLPLGTFLGAAGVATVFVGQPLLRWYGALLGV
jgi:leader peptidase (prepilin peptidase)/N-methyltransferase